MAICLKPFGSPFSSHAIGIFNIARFCNEVDIVPTTVIIFPTASTIVSIDSDANNFALGPFDNFSNVSATVVNMLVIEFCASFMVASVIPTIMS